MARDTVGVDIMQGRKGGHMRCKICFSFIDRQQPALGNGGPTAVNPTQWGGGINALFAVTSEEGSPPVPTPDPDWTRPVKTTARVKTFEFPNSFSLLTNQDFVRCACESPECSRESPPGPEGHVEGLSKGAQKTNRRKFNLVERRAGGKPAVEGTSADSDPAGLGDSDDEEDILDVEDSRLSAKQLGRRERRRELEGCNLLGLPTWSDEGLPPFAEDDKQAEAVEIDQESKRRPVKSKPWVSPTEVQDMSKVVDERLKLGRSQRKDEEKGKKPVGVCAAKDWEEESRREWNEVVKDQDVAREEQRIAGLHILTEGQTATPVAGRDLCAAWASDQNGWRKIRVVMDSGAAECVAPRDMCPQYLISDSAASKSGVFYTSADGGRLDNLGQQQLPIAFDNGMKAMATFQIANVSRPLMGVAKICELGSRVLFGASGGVIVNLGSGQVTPFEKEDGVYVFNMWIPPLSEPPFGRPR